VGLAGLAWVGLTMQAAGPRAAPPWAARQGAGPGARETAAWMHSADLLGMSVVDFQGRELGEIIQLVLEPDGHVQAVVVSVGGFLGIGSRHVAVGWSELTLAGDDDFAVVAFTREELLARPDVRVRASAMVGAPTAEAHQGYLLRVRREMALWRRKVAGFRKDAARRRDAATQRRGEQLDRAWERARARWRVLEDAGEEGWEGARQSFEAARQDLQHTWDGLVPKS
jgi:sporulation protein YlmC with PRC-barrel domain